MDKIMDKKFLQESKNFLQSVFEYDKIFLA